MGDADVPFGDLVSPEIRAEIARQLSVLTDESKSLSALGSSLGASATGEDPEERGRSFLRRRLAELQTAVCGRAEIRTYCSSANITDATSIAVTIAGGLIASSFAGVNVVLVAAVITRIGLRKFCSAVWDRALGG